MMMMMMMMVMKGSVVPSCVLLLMISTPSDAWTTAPHPTLLSTKQSKPTSLLSATVNDNTGIFFDDGECMDLCEITDDILYQVTEEASSLPSSSSPSPPPPADIDPDIARIRLQMQWELWEHKDDCDLEQVHTCGSPCSSCRGGGHVVCRFCSGTKVVSLLHYHSKCKVCDSHGEEVCKACRGSGWVAPWVSLADFPKQL